MPESPLLPRGSSGRCPCGARAVQKHHAVYAQHIRQHGGRLSDKRALVAVCKRCHERHHQRVEVLPLKVLPDSVYEFAVELMGVGAAVEYLGRYYSGRDPRLDMLRASLDPCGVSDI